MEKKELIEINPTWPVWMTVIVTLFNFIGVFLFLLVLWFIRDLVLNNPQISQRIDSYIGIVGYSSALGILTLLGGSSLILLFNPWINFKRLMLGDGLSKLSGSIIFASILLSISFIIMAAN